MTISDLKDLKKLIQLCRHQGVDRITVDGITLELGSAPIKETQSTRNATPNPGIVTEDTSIETFDSLSEEQKLFWSSAPGPDNQ